MLLLVLLVTSCPAAVYLLHPLKASAFGRAKKGGVAIVDAFLSRGASVVIELDKLASLETRGMRLT